IEEETLITNIFNLIRIVADNNNRGAAVRQLNDFAVTLLTKSDVADGNDLVQQQDVCFQMCKDGKGQPKVHAVRIMLYRLIYKLLQLTKIENLVESRADGVL